MADTPSKTLCAKCFKILQSKKFVKCSMYVQWQILASPLRSSSYQFVNAQCLHDTVGTANALNDTSTVYNSNDNADVYSCA